MWFVKVNKDSCDIHKIQAGLPVLMWALHPVGEHDDKPHYHFLLDFKYKRAVTFNPKIRTLLLEPKTTSLKSSPCDENWPADPHSLDKLVAYMIRFSYCQDVWPNAVYWVNPETGIDVEKIPRRPLKPKEMAKYEKLRSLSGAPKTPPLVHEIPTPKKTRKPTQRDLIQHVWDDVQLNTDSGIVDSTDRTAMIKYVYQCFSLKLRSEKLKYDKYQLIQMMNPILCEFADGYNDSLKSSIVTHFLNV